MMHVLALDTATRCGWAVGATGPEVGVMDFSAKKDDGDEAHRNGRIFVRYEAWLDSMIDRYQPALVVLERGLSHNRAHLLLGMRGVALALLTRRRVLHEEVWAATWQAWARKRGLWSKETKSDENDAAAMWAWAQAVLVPRVRGGGAPPPPHTPRRARRRIGGNGPTSLL